jgi:hypothetical protein
MAKNLAIYTLGMKRMYLAEAAKVPQNMESFLNGKGPDAELILKNVIGYHNFDGQGYRPNTPISEIGIKCGHIDLIAGTEDLDSKIYNNSHAPNGNSEISVRFGLVPFSHGLVGELKFPGNYLPEDDGKLEYVTKRSEMKNFIPLYNPRQPENPDRTDRSKNEFSNLFNGTQFEGNLPGKILLNRTVHTVNSKAIWVPYADRK